MEVLVGPTFSIDVSSSTAAAYVRDRSSGGGGGDKVSTAASCLFLKEEYGENETGSGFGVEDSSDGSSSIGAPGDSEDEEDDEVSSKLETKLNGSLLSLGSLEDSLPIKRGLSNHYIGKSKSFANLLDVNVSSVKELEKPDNPFNKRRRIYMANKWSRKSSFYTWQNPKSMPLLALNEDDDEDQDHDDNPSTSTSKDKENKEQEERVVPKLHDRMFKSTTPFKSQSCFSLADLQE